jgi:hypothetical protein
MRFVVHEHHATRLVLMKGRGTGKDWLLIKGRDSFARTDWKIEQALTPSRKQKLAEKIPPCDTR